MAITKKIEIDVSTVQAVGGLENLSKALEKVDAEARSVDKTFEEVYGDLQPLTTRMGEAEDRLYELALAGQSASKEYQDLLATVSNYRKVQIQTDMAVDASATTFNNKLGGALQGITSGFAATQGVMAAFGTESKDLEQALVKVQGAMALSEGIRGIRESASSFKALYTSAQSFTVVQKISTALQYAFNAAMSANPIGVVTTAIIGLVAAGYKLITWYQDSAEANDLAAKNTAKNTQALKTQSKQAEDSSSKLKDYNKYQYDLAKASGASAEELRKLALKHKDEEIALNQKNTMLARSTFLRERDTLASLKNADASEEVIKAQEKLTQDTYKEFEKQRDNYYQSKKDKVALIRQQNVEIKQAETDHNKELADKRKEARQKELEERKKGLEEITKIQKEAANYLEDINKSERQKELEAVDDKNKSKLDLLKKFGKDTTELEKVIAEEKRLINAKFDKQEKDEFLKKEQEKLNFLNQFKEKEKEYTEIKNVEELDRVRQKNIQTLEENKNASLKEAEEKGLSLEQKKQIENFYQSQDEENLKAYTERRKQVLIDLKQKEEETQKAKVDAVFSIAQNGVDMLDSLSKLGLLKGKAAQAAQKALTLAQIGKDTASAISSLIRGSEATGAAAGPAYPVVKTATFVAGLAQILANVAKAKQLLTSSDSGGGSASASPSAAPVAPAPQFNVVGNSGVNQIAATIGQQQPIQAYVVANNVTTAQAMNRNIIENASIG